MNNYHIYEEIGRGQYSVVYKGRKKKTIEYVAVKSVEKSRRKKVLNEVRILHNLDNENILKFFAWYETRNHLWLIFEYCTGGDLLTLIQQDKKIPEDIVKKFAKDLMQGLFYLHSHGILLCDLKPSNILFNEFGNMKIADFGLARRIIDTVSQDEPQQKKGTPYYMAPDLFQENGVYSYASDLWSFGIVLYELASGKVPFQTSSFNELINMIMTNPLQEIPGVSQTFNKLIQRLLEKDPKDRITWEELKAHSFWGEFAEQMTQPMPQQPQFEQYLKSREHSKAQPNCLKESIETISLISRVQK